MSSTLKGNCLIEISNNFSLLNFYNLIIHSIHILFYVYRNSSEIGNLFEEYIM